MCGTGSQSEGICAVRDAAKTGATAPFDTKAYADADAKPNVLVQANCKGELQGSVRMELGVL